ncbi:MAG: hypothetical protein COC12_12295 [Rhodobacteraceae bacterium]|nr:MAG: hypothetical protein COC12_12295 [Paracoccaceae bacterium]
MDLYLVTGSFPRPKVAEITGLNIPDFGTFVTNAQTLANTEPDFNNTDVAAFFDAVTPAVINGSPGDDFIEAGPGLTDIHAGKGNDVVLAGPGGGLIDMGRGSRDALDFRNVSAGIDADLGTGTISSGGIGWSISGVKVLFGSNLADTLVGGGGGDKIFGRAGDDRILGLGGNDTLKGDDGDDRIFGGAGIDHLFGQRGNDRLHGNAGNDIVIGRSGRDRLFGRRRCGFDDRRQRQRQTVRQQGSG